MFETVRRWLKQLFRISEEQSLPTRRSPRTESSRRRIAKSVAYPFTWHIPTEPNVTRSEVPESDKRRDRVFGDVALIEFRNALELVAGYCRAASHVVVFAMGGLACIDFITQRNGAEAALNLAPFREKYHVFGGLNWKRTEAQNKAAFRTWLESLPPNSAVVLFDTGRVGNAAGQLLKFLGHCKNSLHGPLTFQIIVLGQRDRHNGKDHQIIEMRKQMISVIRDVYRIDDVITEDALRLAGAAKLDQRWGLKPTWVSGGIRIRRTDGVLIPIASASIGPAFVQSLINGFDKLYGTLPDSAE
jgi:hypothetical protein